MQTNGYPIDYHGVDPCEWCATESCDGCMIWERDWKAIESLTTSPSSEGDGKKKKE